MGYIPRPTELALLPRALLPYTAVDFPDIPVQENKIAQADVDEAIQSLSKAKPNYALVLNRIGDRFLQNQEYDRGD